MLPFLHLRVSEGRHGSVAASGSESSAVQSQIPCSPLRAAPGGEAVRMSQKQWDWTGDQQRPPSPQGLLGRDLSLPINYPCN